MAMLTDPPPRKSNLKFFANSDRLKTVPLPEDERFVRIAGAIEAAMQTEDMKDVRQVCDDFLGTADDFCHDDASACLRPDRSRFMSTRLLSSSATTSRIRCGSGSG